MEPAELSHKRGRLEADLRAMGGVLVAFSGGVDSTFLLDTARRVLGAGAVAATARSPIQPARQIELAADFTRDRKIEHHWIDSRELENPDFAANPPDRCYLCKKMLASRLLELARRLGLEHVAHGANRDDLGDYRPGMTAAREAGLRAPLLDAGLGKAEIRVLSRRAGLPTWDQPAMACLASRIPYGRKVTREKLAAIDRAEALLTELGFAGCRVRHHGSVARLEVDPDRLALLVRDPLRRRVVEGLRQAGFSHVALDLEGYVTGSLNRELDKSGGGAAPRPGQSVAMEPGAG